MPPIEHVTIRPRGGTVTRILFVPQEFGKDGGMWHQLATPGRQANAVELEEPFSQLDLACGLITPLYASRWVGLHAGCVCWGLAVLGGSWWLCWQLLAGC
jgi:hypothetical protein